MTDYGRHELLDRTSIITHMIDDLLVGHLDIRPEWQAQAAQAMEILFQLYQTIGAEHFGEDE